VVTSKSLGSVVKGAGPAAPPKGGGASTEGATATVWEVRDLAAAEVARWKAWAYAYEWERVEARGPWMQDSERASGPARGEERSQGHGVGKVPGARLYAGPPWAMQSTQAIQRCWDALYRNLPGEKGRQVFGGSVEGKERVEKVMERMRESPRMLVPVFWPLQAREQEEQRRKVTYEQEAAGRVPEGKMAGLYAAAHARAVLEATMVALGNHLGVIQGEDKGVEELKGQMGEPFVNCVRRLGYLLSARHREQDRPEAEIQEAVAARRRVLEREASRTVAENTLLDPFSHPDEKEKARKEIAEGGKDEQSVMDELRRDLVERKVAEALTADLVRALRRVGEPMGDPYCGLGVTKQEMEEEVALFVNQAVEAWFLADSESPATWMDARAEVAQRALPAEEGDDTPVERVRRVLGERRRGSKEQSILSIPSLMLVGEFQKNVAMFTGVQELSTMGAESAPSYLHWTLFDELLKPGPGYVRSPTPEELAEKRLLPGAFVRLGSTEPKNVALVHGDVLQPDLIDAQDAREVLGMAVALYENDELYEKFVRTFNHDQEKFDYVGFMEACSNTSPGRFSDGQGAMGEMPVPRAPLFHMLKRMRAERGAMETWPQGWKPEAAPGYVSQTWQRAWLNRFLVLGDVERRERLDGPLTAYEEFPTAGNSRPGRDEDQDRDVDFSSYDSLRDMLRGLEGDGVSVGDWQPGTGLRQEWGRALASWKAALLQESEADREEQEIQRERDAWAMDPDQGIGPGGEAQVDEDVRDALGAESDSAEQAALEWPELDQVFHADSKLFIPSIQRNQDEGT